MMRLHTNRARSVTMVSLAVIVVLLAAIVFAAGVAEAKGGGGGRGGGGGGGAKSTVTSKSSSDSSASKGAFSGATGSGYGFRHGSLSNFFLWAWIFHDFDDDDYEEEYGETNIDFGGWAIAGVGVVGIWFMISKLRKRFGG